MKILELNSIITKWENLTDDFDLPAKEGERQGFFLMPAHPELKSLFKIDGEIQINSVNTDFVLDVDIVTMANFDTSQPVPTLEDLYEVYKEVRKDWTKKIIEEGKTRGLKLQITGKPTPLENIKPFLLETLRIAYNKN